MVNKKLNRKQAIAEGRKVYWKEKPCPQGHVGWTRIAGGCVECQKVCSNNYKQQNKEALATKRKIYTASEHGKAVSSAWLDNGGREIKRVRIKERRNSDSVFDEKQKIISNNYKDKNKEKLKIKRRNYLSIPENKEKTKRQSDKWRMENADIIRERRREYYRIYMANKRKSDPTFKSLTRMRDFIRRCVESVKGKKNWRTADVLGYTPEEFRHHVESLWQEGMSWENYGKWHIDHVKSIKSFREEGVTDLKVINALGNLQPLWAFDNLSKGA